MKRKLIKQCIFIGLFVFINTITAQESKYTVMEFENNSEYSDISPAFYKEGVIFSSNRKDRRGIQRVDVFTQEMFYDVYYQNENEKIETIKLFKKLNTKYNVGFLTFNKKEDFLFYSKNMSKYSNNKNGVKKKSLGIFSFRLSKLGEWEKEADFFYNELTYSVTHPFISADGKTLYFSSNMPGGVGGMDLYKSIKRQGDWEKPMNLGDKINTEGDEVFPYLGKKERLYFSSDMHTGLGGFDIFYSKKINSEYGKPRNLGAPINSSKDELGFIIRMNEELETTEGYFSSNRSIEKSDDIYYWVSNEQQLVVSGKVFDVETNEAIPNIEISFIDKDGEERLVLADSKGNYSLPVDRNTEYFLSGELEGYVKYSGLVRTNVLSKEKTISKDILFEKDPYLYLEVKDSQTDSSISNVKVILIDNLIKKSKETYSDDSGIVMTALVQKEALENEINYTLKFSKSGYLTKSVTFGITILGGGKMKLPDETLKKLNVLLVRNEIGKNIIKGYDLKPIYYAYNSSELLSESEIELDKLVSIMRNNPAVKFELRSHTDSRGGDAYNLRLSDRRAKAAAKYIKSKLDIKARLKGKGYGEKELLNRCKNNVECTDEEHALNRRTEFIIVE